MMNGSLINHMMASTPANTTVSVGDGATLVSWTDRTPATVVEVISPRKIVVQIDESHRIDENGMSDSQKYRFEPNPFGAKYTAVLRKTGWKVVNGPNVIVGHRDKYYDYSF